MSRGNFTLRSTVILSNKAEPWKSIPICCRNSFLSSSCMEVKLLPSYKISPLSTSNKPTIHFCRTVLPLPLVPIIKFVLPVSITALTPFKIVLSPNALLTFLISIIIIKLLPIHNRQIKLIYNL